MMLQKKMLCEYIKGSLIDNEDCESIQSWIDLLELDPAQEAEKDFSSGKLRFIGTLSRYGLAIPGFRTKAEKKCVLRHQRIGIFDMPRLKGATWWELRVRLTAFAETYNDRMRQFGMKEEKFGCDT